jgi:hypothetical protein
LQHTDFVIGFLVGFFFLVGVFLTLHHRLSFTCGPFMIVPVPLSQQNFPSLISPPFSSLSFFPLHATPSVASLTVRFCFFVFFSSPAFALVQIPPPPFFLLTILHDSPSLHFVGGLKLKLQCSPSSPALLLGVAVGVGVGAFVGRRVIGTGGTTTLSAL